MPKAATWNWDVAPNTQPPRKKQRRLRLSKVHCFFFSSQDRAKQGVESHRTVSTVGGRTILFAGSPISSSLVAKSEAFYRAWLPIRTPHIFTILASFLFPFFPYSSTHHLPRIPKSINPLTRCHDHLALSPAALLALSNSLWSWWWPDSSFFTVFQQATPDLLTEKPLSPHRNALVCAIKSSSLPCSSFCEPRFLPLADLVFYNPDRPVCDESLIVWFILLLLGGNY